MSQKSIVILCIATLIVSLAAVLGFDPGPRALEVVHQGSVKGTEHCMKARSSSLVDEKVTKSICVEKHSRLIRQHEWEHLEGRATARERTLDGSIENGLSSVVITDLKVSATYYDEKGEATSLTGEVSMWAVPKSTEYFNARYEDDEVFEHHEADGCDHDATEHRNCWLWQIVSVRALDL